MSNSFVIKQDFKTRQWIVIIHGIIVGRFNTMKEAYDLLTQAYASERKPMTMESPYEEVQEPCECGELCCNMGETCSPCREAYN